MAVLTLLPLSRGLSRLQEAVILDSYDSRKLVSDRKLRRTKQARTMTWIVECRIRAWILPGRTSE